MKIGCQVWYPVCLRVSKNLYWTMLCTTTESVLRVTDSLAGMDATMKAVECKIALCVEWIYATNVPRGIHTTLPGLLARTAAKRSVEDVITDVRVRTRRRFTTIAVVGAKETRFSEKYSYPSSPVIGI